MVRGLGPLLAYFYSQQRPFYPESLRDDTFRLKQKGKCRLSAVGTYCEERKAKMMFKQSRLPGLRMV